MDDKFFLDNCSKCVFRDRECGNVPTCMRGYISHGNGHMIVIDCKLKKAKIKKDDDE